MSGKECFLLYGTAEPAQRGGALAGTGLRGDRWMAASTFGLRCPPSGGVLDRPAAPLTLGPVQSEAYVNKYPCRESASAVRSWGRGAGWRGSLRPSVGAADRGGLPL